MKRIVRTTVVCVAALAALAYFADYLSLRLNLPRRDAFSSVDVRHFFAVKLKNKQTNYMFDNPRPEECVNSLFPHYGDHPCWYVKRHTTVEVKIDDGPFGPWINTP